ncbi:MAG: cache domain-containing protein [Rhodospirillaceae bacterium]
MVLITYMADQNVVRAFSTNQQAVLDGIAEGVRSEIANTGRLVSAQAELVASLPSVPKLVAAGSRDQLLELLRAGYDIEHRHVGVSVEQLNSINGLVLLRLHKPEHFGDNFTSNRQIVVTVHSTGEPQSGLEIGTSGLAVRGVAPISDAGKTVGSVEFGTKLEPVLAALKAATNADYAVLVDDRLLKALATSADSGNAMPVFNGLRVDSATDLPLLTKLAKSLDFSVSKDRRYGETQLDKIHYGTAMMPLLDYSGKAIGTIFAMRSFEADLHEIGRGSVQLISACAGGIVVLVIVILLLFNGMVLRPVGLLAKATASLAEGKEANLTKVAPGPIRELADSILALKARGESARKETAP